MLNQSFTELEMLTRAQQAEIRLQVEASRSQRSALLPRLASAGSERLDRWDAQLVWGTAVTMATLLLLAGS